ncbi:MAG: DUF364 domain-containing protein [Firmicutes bacterium]|nr:DUF364 domain-containing protein [Bacillota bacterium]
MGLLEDIIANIGEDAPVKEVRIGPFWTGVWSRYCGMATTTFRHEPKKPYHVAEAGDLTAKSGLELCRYALSDSLMESSIGLAAINSLLTVDLEKCRDINAGEVLAEKGGGKKVAVVGHFPFVERLRKVARELWVLERKPQSGDLPASEAERVIPRADVVAITGTALINGTMEGLLKLCRTDSLVMILGPTTPLTPVWFDYGVDLISGTRVVEPEQLLRFISQGIVFKQLGGRAVKLLTMAR